MSFVCSVFAHIFHISRFANFTLQSCNTFLYVVCCIIIANKNENKNPPSGVQINILIVNNFSQHIDELEKTVKEQGENAETIHCTDFKARDAENFDAVILSGGSFLSIRKDYGIYDEQREIIKNSNTPILAICLGFQLLCEEYKSEMTTYYPNKIKGCVDIELLENDSLFTGIKNQKLNVVEAHYHAVTKTGNRLKTLAKSEHGTEVVKHKEKQIYGFQFHPELKIENSNGHLLLRNFLQQIKKIKAQ
ncbi:MAG: homoserine O-succinyltransferase [Candidatus Diapherotrites archaeon]|nr:homoserine O-succinyltransferase [Candidatus Diapherotrites archaeon]